MATLKLTRDNFNTTIENNALVLINFWAPWCGPCRSFSPVYEAASDQHSDVVFAKVNTEEERELATEFQIRSVPTVMLMRDQVVLYAQPGMLSGSQLEQVLAKARSLDMNEVRQAMAKEAQEADDSAKA